MKIKSASKSTKAARQPKASKPPLYDPCEIVFVCGGAVPKGVPDDEGGPCVQSISYNESVNASWILRDVISQTAKNPKRRDFISTDRQMTVFVISDKELTESDRLSAIACSAVRVGTYSEAKKLAEQVQWIQLPAWVTKAEIAQLAMNELQAVREEHPKLEAPDVAFIVWKSAPAPFEGATMMEIGREICDLVFTLGTESVPAFTNDDGDGEEWKKVPA